MLRIIGRIVLLILGLVSLISVFRFPSYTPILLASLLVFITVVWAIKAAVELGLDNVRGQFYMIMAIAFLSQGIGFAFTNIGDVITLPFVGIITYILARFFLFIGNVRYIVYFQSLGYRLNLTRFLTVLLLTFLLIGMTVLVPNVVDMFRTLSPYALFIALDVGMAFIIFYNLLLLWGSEIAKKWAIGSVAIGTYLLGDALFIGRASPTYTLTLWTLASVMMGFIATLEG